MRDKENPPPVVAPHGGKQCCAYLFARAINQSAHYAHKHTYLHKTYTVYYTPVDKHNVLHTNSYTSHILTLTFSALPTVYLLGHYTVDVIVDWGVCRYKYILNMCLLYKNINT